MLVLIWTIRPGGGSAVIDVSLRRRVLAFPVFSFTTGRRYDRRDVVGRHRG